MFTTYSASHAGLLEQWSFNEGTGTSVAGTNTSASNYAVALQKKWNGSDAEIAGTAGWAAMSG